MPRSLVLMLALILTVAVGAGLFALWQREAQTPTPPDFGPIPAITALHENGEPFAGWQSIPQPALIVTLWASWCTVCMAEMPKKLAYVATHPNTALVAISIDTDPAAMRKTRATLPATSGTVVWLYDADKQSAYTPLQATGVPETFVVDRKRHIRAKQNGPTDLQYGPLAGTLKFAQNH